MIIFKDSKLSKKEKQEISIVLSECVDIYGDAYITKQNLRLPVKENLEVLFSGISKKDKLAYDSTGIAFIVGFSDNANRKYLKFLTKSEESIGNMLKTFFWNVKEDLYVKIKKINPLRKILEQNSFEFVAGRGKEILLVRKVRK